MERKKERIWGEIILIKERSNNMKNILKKEKKKEI